ncbi:MAG: DNA N-6-adenine-methyltransferase [Mycobacteriales bacterium]|nr:phage N-6-adenine-methyltransferase [Actinomycetota bacterium]
MKPVPAIVEPAQVDVDAAAEHIIVSLAGEKDADRTAVRHEGLAAAARETAKLRRLEVGRWLNKVRPTWPASGPKARGWSEFLARVGLDDSTAVRYMDAARTSTVHGEPPRPSSPQDPAHGRQVSQISGEAPPGDVAPVLSLVPSPDAEVEIDRDTWCTPPWLTEPLGRFDLDPCSNERSQVQAATTFVLDLGIDGLARGEDVNPGWRVFINPPYSDVPPWIAAYKHTRFCFLLKLDTSTKWFAELHAASALILIPRRRVNFIPPPGVPPERAVAQQFPHALFYANAEDATDAIRAMCWSWRVDH